MVWVLNGVGHNIHNHNKINENLPSWIIQFFLSLIFLQFKYVRVCWYMNMILLFEKYIYSFPPEDNDIMQLSLYICVFHDYLQNMEDVFNVQWHSFLTL